MKIRIFRAAAAMLAAACLYQTAFAAPGVSAKAAILLDADSGQVVFEKNADEPGLIASTTKIMTALLICESEDLSREVTVPDAAVGIEGSSLYLQKGERLTVEALLYGMMLHSGNDAAAALAILSAGSVERFVERMNLRARGLWLPDIHFANPSGLDDEGNYASARSLALLTAEAMKNERFRTVVGTKTAVYGGRSLTNHNKLLWQYPGALGVKTGYTKQAGRILVSCAERNGRRLVCVTMNDPDDWRDHKALLDYGFGL